MICAQCGVHREAGKMLILDSLHYCKHCHGAKTRGYSNVKTD